MKLRPFAWCNKTPTTAEATYTVSKTPDPRHFTVRLDLTLEGVSRQRNRLWGKTPPDRFQLRTTILPEQPPHFYINLKFVLCLSTHLLRPQFSDVSTVCILIIQFDVGEKSFCDLDVQSFLIK